MNETHRLKFELGTWVWFLHENKAVQDQLIAASLEVQCDDRGAILRNATYNTKHRALLKESQMFPTKQALLKSL